MDGRRWILGLYRLCILIAHVRLHPFLVCLRLGNAS